jgi:hypothetical protein
MSPLSHGSSLPPFLYQPGANSLSVTFKTHLNYIKCMARLMENLAIDIHINPTTRLNPTILTKFDTLARITATSIEGEKKACDREKAYAQVASPWIPVKCYYRLYYLESMLLYLMNGSTIGFGHGGHSKVKQAILRLLKDDTISISGTHATSLSTITNWQTANSYRSAPGSTITASYHSTTECIESLKKKVAVYIEIDWKQNENILNYKTDAARAKRSDGLHTKEFCLLDYFYWMRIKANYRDIDFLDFDNNVNEDDAYEYLNYYIKASNLYAASLMDAIGELKVNRNM